MMSFDLSLMLDKRSSERKLFHIDLSLDLPRDALILEVLDVAADEIEGDESPIALAPPAEWLINSGAVRYPDGRFVTAGKAMQGWIEGGSDGAVYTIRALYRRSDDPGPHEATVLLRVRDTIRPGATA